MFYVLYFYAPRSLDFVTIGFVHQLQSAENIIILVIEKLLHCGLDGTMILYNMHCLLCHKLKLD